MDKIRQLQEQASRAERLARNVLDTLTVERLSVFVAECHDQIKLLTEDHSPTGPEQAVR
jgi:hypothetical protein